MVSLNSTEVNGLNEACLSFNEGGTLGQICMTGGLKLPTNTCGFDETSPRDTFKTCLKQTSTIMYIHTHKTILWKHSAAMPEKKIMINNYIML